MKSCTMRAKAGVAEVLLYDPIGELFDGVSAKQFANDLKALGKVSTINLRINSDGGLVHEGLAIYNTLSRHSARVEVDIDGIALSIASLIAMAGDEIRIAANGLMMVHSAWSITAGNADELRKEADLLDKTTVGIAGTYAARTRKPAKQILELMAAETWMQADEAAAMGFVDSVTAEKRIAARFDADRFRRVPDFAKARAAVEVGTPRLDERRAKVAHMGLRLRRDDR